MALNRTVANEQHVENNSTSSTYRYLSQIFSNGRDVAKNFTYTCLDNILPADDATSVASMGFTNQLRNAVFPGFVNTALLFSYAAVTNHFIDPDTNWYQNPIFFAAVISTINFAAYLPSPSNAIIRRLIRMARAALYSSMEGKTKNILLHEGGHAITALGLFNHSNPTIQINSFSGWTRYHDDLGLTPLGKALGQDTSHTLVSAMGTGSVLIQNYLYLIAAHAVPANYPEIKAYLRFSVCLSVFNDIIYILTAYGDCKDKSNDFCNLKAAGISPTLAILAMGFSFQVLHLFLSFIPTCQNRAINSRNNDLEEPSVSEIINIYSPDFDAIEEENISGHQHTM